MENWARNLFFMAVGAVFVSATTLPAFDRVYAPLGISNPANTSFCMNDNLLYFDAACNSEYIDGSAGFLEFYASATSVLAFTSTVVSSRKYLNLEDPRLRLNSALFGEIRGVSDDSTQLCTEDDDTRQNNNWALVPRAGCGSAYGLSTPSSHPTLWFMSNSGAGSPAEKGRITHDSTALVLDSDTGPVKIDRALGGNETKLTASATIDDAYNVIYLDATSGNLTATLPAASGCTGQIYTLKRIDGSANTCTVASSDNIDGAASKSLAQWDSLTVKCSTTDTTYYIH